MTNLPVFLVSLLIYVGCCRFALSRSDPRRRSVLFAVVNIATLFWLTLQSYGTYDEHENLTILQLGSASVIRHIFLVGLYVAAIGVGYFLMKWFARRDGVTPWLAFFYPIAILVFFRYFTFVWEPITDQLGWIDLIIQAAIFGVSYMAFRLSYLVLQVRNGVVPVPSLSEYLGFAFFLPTMVVGPINPYSVHQQSLEPENRPDFPVGRSLLRILVGATKYLFLANIVNQLTYSGLFTDGKPHAMIDLAVAIIAYYLYLFFNFSGFCDMAIGLAALVGVRVKENFDNPFVARNVKEFWNRWHITLSEYTRDVVFAPISKAVIRRFGPKYANLAISLGVTAVFLTIGIWHGIGRHYIYFGLLHAFAVIVNHYYTIFMKKALGKQRYKAYNENPYVNAVAMVMTFLYVACTFALFANTLNRLGEIRNALAASGWQLF